MSIPQACRVNHRAIDHPEHRKRRNSPSGRSPRPHDSPKPRTRRQASAPAVLPLPVSGQTDNHQRGSIGDGGDTSTAGKGSGKSNLEQQIIDELERRTPSDQPTLSHTGGIDGHIGDSNNTDSVLLRINVGGKVFETYLSTLRSMPDCNLSDPSFLARYHRPEKDEYFFDRDSAAFRVVLNYMRTGELHVPTFLCGPSIKHELEFWGVDDSMIERCCWSYYNTWQSQSESLIRLENDMKNSMAMYMDNVNATKWERIRASVWSFLHEPSYSIGAKVYAWVSVCFIIVSVSSFCIETHPTFKVHKSRDLMARVFGKNIHESGSTGNGIVNTTTAYIADIPPNGSNSQQESAFKDMVSHPALVIIDFICLLFFTLEFLTRMTFSPGKVRFLLAPLNIIDFIAILPDYVELVIMSLSLTESDGISFIDFIFILRIIRICRIFRLIRHVPGLWILLYTLKASFNELLLMVCFLIIGMVVFSSVIYFAEMNGDFKNIPVGFWWSIITMTTVGYGDMHPVTGLGYLIGSFCALTGLLMIGFTVPIIVGNFILYYTHIQYGLPRRVKQGSLKSSQNSSLEDVSKNRTENTHT